MKGEWIVIFAGAKSLPVAGEPLDGPPTLERLHRAVGGYIEIVPSFKVWRGRPCVAFCNEDGKRLRLPVNRMATAAWETAAGCSVAPDYLCGDVLVLTGDRAFMRRL